MLVAEFLKSPAEFVKNRPMKDVMKLLTDANEQYRNNSVTVMSDELYDWLREYALKKDPSHPFFKMVGAPVANKEALPVWMGSLDKIRDDPKALDSWMSKYEPPYVLSDKLDGVSGLFAVKNDNTIELFTRGDGEYGRNISSYVKFFNKDLQIDIGGSKKKYPLLVRGELLLSKKAWDTVKQYGGSNARNVIAGTLNTRTPDERIAKHLHFVAYELIEPAMPFTEGLALLKKMGFNVVYHSIIPPEDVNNTTLSKYLLARRDASDYEIDGIVVRHDKHHKIVKNKNPKYAFAFKSMLTHESAEVTVLNIIWNVSKDGLIKPTIEFTPVFINNVKIKQTTGFNASYVEKNKIGAGSKIVIIRSGDVIPHIVKVLSPAETGEALMPSIPYEWTPTHVDIRIKQDAENDQMKVKQMEHFVKVLEIENVGAGILKKMFEAGIDTIPKLLSVQKSDLLLLDKIKEKSADKIHSSIQTALERTNCMKLMVASNVFGKGLGSAKLQVIVDNHPEILQRALLTSLKKIQGIGDNTEKEFLDNLPKFYAFLEEINYTCAPPKKAASSRKSSPKTKIFEGMTIVFTGFRNKEWSDKIASMGGKMGTSISKNTTIVVVGDKDKDTAKLVKARENGTRILEKTEFLKAYPVLQ